MMRCTNSSGFLGILGSLFPTCSDSESSACTIYKLLQELVTKTEQHKVLWQTTTYESQLAYVTRNSNNDALLLVPQAPLELPKLLYCNHALSSTEELVKFPYKSCQALAVGKLYEAAKKAAIQPRNNVAELIATFLTSTPPPPPARMH